MTTKHFVSICITLLISVAIFSQNKNAVFKPASDIEYSYFEEQLKYLSSDEMKGRNTGSEEYAKAAQHVANEFKKAGLEPFGDNNTYFQHVSFIKNKLIKSSVNISAKNKNGEVKAEYGDNISIFIQSQNTHLDYSQELVFAGYGNILPAYDIDDYKGLDVKEKTVIIALGGPKHIRLKKLMKSIKKGNHESKALNTSFSCTYDVDLINVDCKNVVGLLPAKLPQQNNEYIVVGAHLDHLGVSKTIKGDSIYNGMWDNASGVAALMTMAKSFKHLDKPHQRSIVFVAYTGEEKGLLGSNYFANKHSERDNFVGNINIDMLYGIYETNDVIPLGYSHSNLAEAIDFAAEETGVKITESEMQEKMYIERSDQISFIKNGIPALKFCFLTTVYAAYELEKIEWNTQSWLYQKYVAKISK